MQSIDVARTIIWIALFFLVAGPVHECAHAYTALRLGDGTAKLFGRVSLDPIVHFDPVGGMLLVFTALLGLAYGGGLGLRLGQAHAGQPVQPSGPLRRRQGGRGGPAVESGDGGGLCRGVPDSLVRRLLPGQHLGNGHAAARVRHRRLAQRRADALQPDADRAPRWLARADRSARSDDRHGRSSSS